MGCGSSSDAARHRREADEYRQRKKHGFKDPGLERVRKQTVRQKKRLRHVDDPLSVEHRQEKKMADIKSRQRKEQQQQAQQQQQQQQQKKGWGLTGRNNNKNEKHVPAPPVVMTEDTIAAQRKNLKHVVGR